METLVLYYSGTGHNRSVAEHLAKTLKTDIREIRKKKGFSLGMFGVAMRSMFGRGSPIACDMDLDVGKYDTILVVTPVYAFHLAPPVKSCLSQIDFSKKNVSVLFVCGGMPRRGPKTVKKIVEKNGGKFMGYEVVDCDDNVTEDVLKESVSKAKKLLK